MTPTVAPVPVVVNVDGATATRRLPPLSRSGLRTRLAEDFPEARVVVHDAGGVLLATVSTPDTVAVRVDGRTVLRTTHAETPSAVLREAGIGLGPLDTVRLVRGPQSGPGVSGLNDGDRIKVVRVSRAVSRQRVKVPAPVRKVATDDLIAGQRRVETEGSPGLRVVRVTRTSHDGRVVSTDREVLRRRAPQPRVVLVGTADRPEAPASDSGPWPAVGGGAESKNWAALAQCEASGNPRAVNPAGYYGLYQFNTGTWASVGGTGLPSDATAAEQTYRAKLLFASRGAQPWPHCGRYL